MVGIHLSSVNMEQFNLGLGSDCLKSQNLKMIIKMLLLEYVDIFILVEKSFKKSTRIKIHH